MDEIQNDAVKTTKEDNSWEAAEEENRAANARELNAMPSSERVETLKSLYEYGGLILF